MDSGANWRCTGSRSPPPRYGPSSAPVEGRELERVGPGHREGGRGRGGLRIAGTPPGRGSGWPSIACLVGRPGPASTGVRFPASVAVACGVRAAVHATGQSDRLFAARADRGGTGAARQKEAADLVDRPREVDAAADGDPAPNEAVVTFWTNWRVLGLHGYGHTAAGRARVGRHRKELGRRRRQKDHRVRALELRPGGGAARNGDEVGRRDLKRRQRAGNDECDATRTAREHDDGRSGRAGRSALRPPSAASSSPRCWPPGWFRMGSRSPAARP